MVFCYTCGKRIESDGAAFCPRCGMHLAGSPPPAYQVQYVPQPGPPRPRKNKKQASGCGCMTWLIVAAILVAYWSRAVSHRPHPRPVRPPLPTEYTIPSDRP